MNRLPSIPLELLQTFVRIVEHDGDATAAAQALGISQPSISRRLSALREIVGEADDRAWLILKGKRWLLTPAGERAKGVVADLVRRYEQVEYFLSQSHAARPIVSIACGQTAAAGIVRLAIQRLMNEHSAVQVRLSTVRGRSRIEGVAGGQFDLAIVTDDEATIRDVAGIELHVESLLVDRFVVAANPFADSPWGKGWSSLPKRRPVRAKDLIDLPLILPEADAGRRQQFDRWYQRSTGRSPDPVLEVGGWQNLLRYVQSGLGVGFATATAVMSMGARPSAKSTAKPTMSTRSLDERDFPPEEVRIITRKPQGQDRPDLNRLAMRLFEFLKKECPLS
jgi:DNA-binding transcriptional LysR family regulator